MIDTVKLVIILWEICIYIGMHSVYIIDFSGFYLIVLAFLNLGFTSCKAEQPLHCIELQENKAQKY